MTSVYLHISQVEPKRILNTKVANDNNMFYDYDPSELCLIFRLLRDMQNLEFILLIVMISTGLLVLSDCQCFQTHFDFQLVMKCFNKERETSLLGSGQGPWKGISRTTFL